MLGVYVSVTGFTPHSLFKLPRFWWHTLRCLSQARACPGNLGVTARYVQGVYHTMTLWTNEESMHAYLGTGAHLKAMRGFRAIGSGKTFGYYTGRAPEWGAAYAMWIKHARDV